MGSGKKQTIGYRIYLSVHAVLVHGPVDLISRIQFAKKDAWTGSSTGGELTVDAEELFGGEKREGGVSGAIDFESGALTQGRNAHLQSLLGVDIPAFRKVAALVFKNFYFGMNPYLKVFSARLQRIHTSTDGALQWYDEKAAVPDVSNPGGHAQDVLSALTYLKTDDASQLTFTSPADTLSWSLDPADYTTVPAIPGVHNWSSGTGKTSLFWIVADFPDGVPVDTLIDCKLNFDDSGKMLSSGPFEVYEALPPEPIAGYPREQGLALLLRKTSSPVFGRAVIACVDVRDIDTGSIIGSETAHTLKVTLGLSGVGGDMNPAHIIREALTDPDWGMGYSSSDIDDVSFTEAADTLYNEGMGISFLWDKQMPLEDFIKEVLHHIVAALYVSRSTGKFILKLIRQDYVIADLPVLGEDEIDRVENFSYAAFGELVNSVTVNYWDRETNTSASVTEQDPALVQMQGVTINTTMQYVGFTNKGIASRVALRDLASLSIPLRSGTIYAKTSSAKDLNIGDVFVLNWPRFKVAPMLMRITGMALGDGKTNKIRLNVMEDVFTLPDASNITPPDTGWTNPSTAPVPATERLVVEAPYFELIQRQTQSTVDSTLLTTPSAGWVLAAAARPSAGSLNARINWDNGSGYEEESETLDFSPVAFLTTSLTINGTSITVGTSTDLDLIATATHAQIDDEIVAVDAIAGTTLTIGRGCLDTVPVAHASGARILFWDQFGEVIQTEFAATETVDVKVLPTTGQGTLPIASATADSVTLNMRAVRPYPPGKVRIGGAPAPTTGSGNLVVTWTHRDRGLQADQLVDHEASSVGPEATVRYAIKVYDATNTLLTSKLNIGDVTATINLAYTGNITIHLYAISDNGDSYQTHVRELAYTATSGPTGITATDYVPPDNTVIIDGGGA